MKKLYCDRCGIIENFNPRSDNNIILRHFESLHFEFDLCRECSDYLEDYFLEFRNKDENN